MIKKVLLKKSQEIYLFRIYLFSWGLWDYLYSTRDYTVCIKKNEPIENELVFFSNNLIVVIWKL